MGVEAVSEEDKLPDESVPDEPYLWDRSGPPEPDVERLERTLAPLAHAPDADFIDRIEIPKTSNVVPLRRRDVEAAPPGSTGSRPGTCSRV